MNKGKQSEKTQDQNQVSFFTPPLPPKGLQFVFYRSVLREELVLHDSKLAGEKGHG